MLFTASTYNLLPITYKTSISRLKTLSLSLSLSLSTPVVAIIFSRLYTYKLAITED